MKKTQQQFSEIQVDVPDIDEYRQEFKVIDATIRKARDPRDAFVSVRQYFNLCDRFNSTVGIISIHFTQDTTNPEYQKAQETVDEESPLFLEIAAKVEESILKSPYLNAIKEEFGDLFIKRLELEQKCFKPEIVKDIQEENRLSSEYSKIISAAQIEFDGKMLNIPQIQKFTSSEDRDTRQRASAAMWGFFAEHDEEIGAVYDRLVKVRDKMARQLGYESFIPLGYARLGRLGYDAKDVASYREQILAHLTPLSEKYRQKQIKRIEIDDPHYYDYSVNFKDGNPLPCGDTKKLVAAAKKMYGEMDPKIGEYFAYLDDHGHLDLEARAGKQSGGYEEYIPSLQAPFIFSNFNGTQGDVEVLTHEFGHALQAFLGSTYEVPSYRSPGFECCEMHSMSMEYLAYPYIGYFFDVRNAKKYRYQHIIDAIYFLPYGVTVDEFQHRVYEKPELTHAERKMVWREIEKKYLPYRQYGRDSEFLESGGFWLRQAHIFNSPFYYIDYTIAQVVSLEFLVESEVDYAGALSKYLRFSKLGGSLDYHELLRAGKIDDPLEPGVIEELMPKVAATLEKYEKAYRD